tara:strand:- start:5716 stop:7734 length:2019 start_codon:yes stop_codon:yes gene_type:complete
MEKNMNTVVFIQARLGSKRFPRKILSKYKKTTMIEILLKRLNLSKKIKKIIFVIPDNKENVPLKNFIKKLGYNFFCGSEENVLSRFYFAAQKFKPTTIIRITSDCPLIDPFILDKMIEKYNESKFDYLSNTINPTYPDGFDVEIFSRKTLSLTFKNAYLDYDKEHVTPYIKREKIFNIYNYSQNKNYSDIRITLDTRQDLKKIKTVLNYFSPRLDFKFLDILKIPKKIMQSLLLNRVSNYEMTNGEKMWKKAKEIIPDGNMFFSKRPELFLKKSWPTYYSKAKGCYIWDLDKIRYIDCSYMGIGTNLLGYANKNIDNKVIDSIKNSNMSTLNSSEEVFLADKLLNLDKWAGGVKFARTGGEANLIALRIARSYNKKYKVIFCGYHGWHDWYLSSNLKNKKNLDKHLISNLKIEGVPRYLKNSTYSFTYNDFDSLKKIIDKEKDIGVLIMEVTRNILPKKNFLNKIRNICTNKNIVLIFDECTSGFRETVGGIHQKFGVNPDIAIYGKAIGNGYAINPIVGKKEIMDCAKKTFISSTFWSDKIGFVAAIETIRQMEISRSWIKVKQKGLKIKQTWKKIFIKHKIDADIIGLDSLPTFIFKKDHKLKKTFITLNFLKKKIFATNSFYVSLAHTDKIIDLYLKEFEKIIIKLKKQKNLNKEVGDYLAEDTFKRLN